MTLEISVAYLDAIYSLICTQPHYRSLARVFSDTLDLYFLMLHRGERVSDIARTLCCARSSIGRWINWFTLSGVEGLKLLPARRSRRWSFEHICTLLRELIKHSPGDFG